MKLFLPVVFVLLVAACENQHLTLETMGVMYVGGEMVNTDMACAPSFLPCPESGTVSSGHARVEYLVPAKNVSEYPIVMVHGLGLSSDLYLAGAGGGEGWVQFFARRGYPVYAMTLPSVAASGVDTSAFNRVKADAAEPESQPTMYAWVPEAFWRIFGYGPKFPELYDGVQYRAEQLPTLLASASPYISTELAASQRQDAAALVALLEKTGPAILMTHSLSGEVGFTVAYDHPDLVAAIVAIESAAGCPDPGSDEGNMLHGTPLLSLWGDFLDTRRNGDGRTDSCKFAAETVSSGGGLATHIELPQAGITGNTHMIPVDQNSEEVAGLVADWLNEIP